MHIKGFIDENPKVGGLEQDVTYNKKLDFYSALNYERTVHKSSIV